MSEKKLQPWDLDASVYAAMSPGPETHEKMIQHGWFPSATSDPQYYTLRVGVCGVCRLHYWSPRSVWVLTCLGPGPFETMQYLANDAAVDLLRQYIYFGKLLDESIEKEAIRRIQEAGDSCYARVLDALAEDLHKINVSKGFSHKDNPFRGLMLIVAEVTEAAEALRSKCKDLSEEDAFRAVWTEGGKEEGVAVELADAIIRALSLCKEFGLPIGEILMRKVAYNRTRPFKHGKAF